MPGVPAEMQSVDVLVVGAGPTGLSLAGELLRYGVSVRVVDKAATQSADHSRALGIHPRTLEVFEQFGIVDEVVATGKPVDALNICSSRGARGRVAVSALKGLDTPWPMMLGLPQARTEALLGKRMEALGGHVDRGVALASYSQDDSGVTAHLTTAEGGEETLRARWIVGCDGTRSAVRTGAGIAFEGDTYKELCMVGDVTVDWELPSGGLYIMPSRHGVAAAFAEPGENNYRLVMIAPNEDIATERFIDRDTYEGYIKRMVPYPVKITEARFLSRYRLHHRVASAFRSGRAFVAGDAAHVHSPVGGQGMNTGISDAFNLGWKLALVTRGEAPAWILDTYEQERRKVALRLVSATDAWFGAMTSRGWLPMLLREVWPVLAGYIMLIPALQRRMLGFTSQIRIRYPNSDLTTDCTPEGAPAAPAAGCRAPDVTLQPCGAAANPKTLAPSASPPPARLFQLLRGTHHTLLAFCEPGHALAHEVAELQARYGALLRMVRVGRGADAASPNPNPNPAPMSGAMADGAVPNGRAHAGAAVLQCVDADGSVHKRYGVTAPCAFLIRPDMYIGVARAPAGALTAEVERRFA